jgi:hypothetical protein
MKNRSIIIVILLGIGLLGASCNKDDNEGETIAPLAGKWSISKIGTTVSGVETLVDAPQNQSGCDRDYLNLKIDNTVTKGDYDSTISPCALLTIDGIYSRSHNNLTTVYNGLTKVQDIANLTITELKLKDSNGDIEIYVKI